jgi:hypothetical protein
MDCNLYHTIGIILKQPRLEGRGSGFTSPSGRRLTILPWRMCVVTKIKLQKANIERKSVLACHLLRLL